MKKQFLLLVMLLFTTLTFAFNMVQDVPIEEPSFLGLTGKLAIAILLGSLITAINHIMAGTFSISAWFGDTLKPALIAFGISLVLLALDLYVKSIDALIESVFSIETDWNDTNALAATAFLLVPIVKGFFKREQTQIKVANKG